MEIYLLRHGLAERPGAGCPDSERALSAEGREDVRRVIQRARASGARPTLILSSPYRRAIETAETAAETCGYKEAIERAQTLTPDSSPYEAWEEIRARKSAAAILLAGHEPLLSSLGAFLLGSPALSIEMTTAALLRVDCDGFGAQPKAVLKWMLTPATA